MTFTDWLVPTESMAGIFKDGTFLEHMTCVFCRHLIWENRHHATWHNFPTNKTYCHIDQKDAIGIMFWIMWRTVELCLETHLVTMAAFELCCKLNAPNPLYLLSLDQSKKGEHHNSNNVAALIYALAQEVILSPYPSIEKKSDYLKYTWESLWYHD